MSLRIQHVCGTPAFCFFQHKIQPTVQKQHQHFNALLNSLMMKPPPTSNSPIAYKHYHLIDTFYNDEDAPNREKIRVTRDERTGEVRECLRKIRLADLNIFSPKRAADWRVSVNMEVPGKCSCLGLNAKEQMPICHVQCSTRLALQPTRERKTGCLTRTKSSSSTSPRL